MYDLIDKSPMATLATLDKELSTPFTSLVAFVVDDKGNPIVFISDLAIHTKNIEKQGGSSLMVSDVNKDNLFNSKRVTYTGTMEKVADEEEVKKLKKLYLAKFPDSEELMQLADFNFHRLKIKKVYYIGGFGGGDWIELDEYQKHWHSGE